MPIVVWVDRMYDEVALGLSYLIQDHETLCESVTISDLSDLKKVELKLTASLVL